MAKKKVMLITGSQGLIGSEASLYFGNKGYEIHGIDNNMRKFFFGDKGDTSWNLKRLKDGIPNFVHHDIDIRDRMKIFSLLKENPPEAIIHCAAQPSHDWAKKDPLLDFEVNAVGTHILLEATRTYSPEAPFVFMSTNKVYGDSPNYLPLEEKATRWEYSKPEHFDGIDETQSIDGSKHSIFGASKVAADVMVQEYGKYFGMNTVSFRGGCLTGPQHSGVELHGFLSYLIKVAVSGGMYTIFGYKGKQVRDQIHSYDVVRAFEEFVANPKQGVVYNLGGGRGNSMSILETFDKIKSITGKTVNSVYDEKNREGDHICYISNLKKLKTDYPDWGITKKLDNIMEEMIDAEASRLV
ncbi:MAG: NAD-dependent epimerase [Candidatus Sungbacteria bacterium RIFCSPLOWO2_02_FULL_47_9]|nr:MAG: NAD-dependent epimerase [Candidatus Sungbacteria bacterium RIFCSPLOWO2_02_FULL_47_9]